MTKARAHCALASAMDAEPCPEPWSNMLVQRDRLPVAIAAVTVAVLASIEFAGIPAVATGIITAIATAEIAAVMRATRTRGAWLRLAYTDVPVAQHGSVQGRDSVLRRGSVGHLDEAKAFAAAALAVHHDRCLDDIAKRAKSLRQLFVVSCVGQIAHVDTGSHEAPSFKQTRADALLAPALETTPQANPCGARRP